MVYPLHSAVLNNNKLDNIYKTMMKQIIFSLMSLAAAAAFSTTTSPSILQISRSAYDVPRASSILLRQSTDNIAAAEEDTDDVTCYITNDEEIINDGEKPHVVCTSEKEEVSLLYHITSNFCSLIIIMLLLMLRINFHTSFIRGSHKLIILSKLF